MMSPTAPKFILFAHARSGSSNLLKALQLHPWLRIAEEPFHEKYHVWHPDERKYVELITDVPSLETQLAVLFAKYNGIKVLDYQLPMELYTHLLLRPEFRVIFLQRRNLLQAVISGGIAKQTGVWKMWDLRGDLATVYAHLQPIPLDEIAQTLAYQRELQEYYRQVIVHKPKDMCLLLEYETFYTDDILQNRAAMQRVFGFLGLEMPAREELDDSLNPRTSKINSNRTYTYVPNAEEINARFGSNETGWLFEEQPVHNYGLQATANSLRS